MIRIVIKEVALALVAGALTACTPTSRSACEGMVYKESGLTREQFRPCAAEMVKQLDRAQSALEMMADKSRPSAARSEARRECIAAASDLTRSLRAAGGSTKLMARWDDVRLNEFSFAVISAKDYYTMVCYYGPKLFDQAEQSGAPLNSSRDSNYEKARQILSEIQ
jgi:hypothetical protein